MADPATLAIGAAVGGGLLQASSAIQQGKAAQASAQYNAMMAERSARIAEQQAEQLKRASEFDIQRFRDDFSDLQASSAQAFRYNGFIATSGTPLQVLLENAREADEEIALRRYNTAIDQQQALESATEQRMEARLQRMQGSQARRAGYLQAAGSLLSTAGRVSQMGG